ncbi:hypothetical protein ACHQM5_018004 [Ranunculus cassubicifolius]
MLSNNRISQSPYSTMEEVWEDSSVSSLHQDHHPHTRQPTNLLAYNHYNHTSFQDLLARPFDRDQDFSLFGSSVSVATAPTPPRTSLCLNSSVRELYCLDNNCSQPSQSSFDESCSAFPPFGKKRGYTESDDSTGDRRHKRMIKNRESASRSRARKQSYTNGLEIQVAHLERENKSLRKQQQEQIYLAAVVQLPRKHNLRRTLSAPLYRDK